MAECLKCKKLEGKVEHYSMLSRLLDEQSQAWEKQADRYRATLEKVLQYSNDPYVVQIAQEALK